MPSLGEEHGTGCGRTYGGQCVEHWVGDAVEDEVGRLAGPDHSGPESPAKEFGSLSNYLRNL